MPSFTSVRMTTKKISDSTVRRLSRYLRQLREFERHDSRIVSSTELASGSGTTAAQVRKDLSHFGSFGKRGQGYSVPDLRQRLEDILGLSRRWPVAVIGVGKIGSALLGYGRFANKGFDIIAAFDSNPARVGLEIGGVRVNSVDEIRKVFAEEEVAIAIISTPPEEAQTAADRAIEAGASAILNFAPIKLDVPPGIAMRTMDVTLELEGLSYLVTAGRAEGGGD